jgi:hypothetical protein
MDLAFQRTVTVRFGFWTVGAEFRRYGTFELSGVHENSYIVHYVSMVWQLRVYNKISSIERMKAGKCFDRLLRCETKLLDWVAASVADAKEAL